MAPLTECHVPTGPNESHPKRRPEESLVTTVVAFRNVTIHVRLLSILRAHLVLIF